MAKTQPRNNNILFNFIFLLMTAIALMSTFPAVGNAETVAATNNPAPFGLTLGLATVDDLKAKWPKSSGLVEKGINKYTNGPRFYGPGEGAGIEGLKEATFIFNRDKKLAVVILEGFPKGTDNAGTRKMAETLASKYKVVKKNIRALGDSSAEFHAGNTTITLNAPHLSFTFTVTYLTDEAISSFETQERSERKLKDAATKDRL